MKSSHAHNHTHLGLVFVKHLKFDASVQRDRPSIEDNSRVELRVTVVLERKGVWLGGVARADCIPPPPRSGRSGSSMPGEGSCSW